MTRPCRSEVVVEEHLLDDLRERGRGALDGAGERIATQGAEADAALLDLLPRQQPEAVVVDHDQRTVPLDHRTDRAVVQRHDGDLLEVDVLPHVELGPVGEREDAQALALVEPDVVGAPQLRALQLGVPAVLRGADGEDPLLRA